MLECCDAEAWPALRVKLEQWPLPADALLSPPQPTDCPAKSGPVLPPQPSQSAPQPAPPEEAGNQLQPQKFEVGEQVEVQVIAGPRQGSWAKSRITEGPTPDGSYGIEVFPEPGSQKPTEKVPSVPGRFLRRSFDIGDLVEVEVLAGPGAGSWAKSRIMNGPAADGSYSIEVCPDPRSQQPGEQVPSVEARFLRKIDLEQQPFEIGEQVEVEIVAGPLQGSWAKSQVTAGPACDGTYSIEVFPEPGSQKAIEPVPSVPGPFLRRNFGVGDLVDVQVLAGPRQGSWARSQITAPPSSDGSYSIEVFPEPGSPNQSEQVPGVSGRYLRRRFRQGDRVEVHVLAGPRRGIWAKSRVMAEPAADGSYDIEVLPEIGNDQPGERVPGVKGHHLRRDVSSTKSVGRTRRAIRPEPTQDQDTLS